MSKLKLSYIVDCVFKFAILLFLFLVVFRCLKLNYVISLILSCVLSLAVMLILFALNNHRKKQKNIKIGDAKIVQDLSEKFLFAKDVEIKKYFFSLFSTKFLTKKCKNGLFFEKNQKKYLVKIFFSEKTLTFVSFNKIHKTLNESQFDKIFVLCIEKEKDAVAYAKMLKCSNYEIMDMTDVYVNFIKPFNVWPTFEIQFETMPKPTMKDFFSNIIARKKSKSYFGFGLLIFVSSFFVPMSIYYLIFSFVLFLLAFLSRFIQKPQLVQKDIY